MRRARSRPRRWATAAALGAALAGCGDPVADERVAALGGEAPGVGPGPYHRPGQPCLACHSPEGAGETPFFSVAGTVFHERDSDIAAEGAIVHLTDRAGDSRLVVTNCAGNFWLSEKQWQPSFPLRVEVAHPSLAEPIVMQSKIAREGSCGACHTHPPGPSSPGRIWLVDDSAPDAPRPICGRRSP